MNRALRVLLAVALLLPLASACVPGTGGDTKTITVYFDDTAGLFVGNDVGILGVTIGEITDIVPEGREVRVTLAVEADRRIPADVGAMIVARSVATDRYVELAPVYTGGAELQDGDTITRLRPDGSPRTQTPVDFDQVLEALNTFATGIAGSKKSRDAVRRIIEDGSAALDGNGQLLNDTVTDVAGAAGDVAAQREDVAAVVRALDGLVATLADNQQTTRDFIGQVAAAADLLDDEKVAFRRALRNLDRTVTTVAAFAVDHRDEILQVVGGSKRLFRTLDGRQQQLAEILEVFPLALQNLKLAADAGGDRLPVRADPKVLLPLGDQITELCESLPLGLCDLLSGTDPSDRAVAPVGAKGVRR